MATRAETIAQLSISQLTEKLLTSNFDDQLMASFKLYYLTI